MILANNMKVRPANLTTAEKEFLVELALKYQAMIETRRAKRLLHMSVVPKIITTNYRRPSLLNSALLVIDGQSNFCQLDGQLTVGEMQLTKCYVKWLVKSTVNRQ